MRNCRVIIVTTFLVIAILIAIAPGYAIQLGERVRLPLDGAYNSPVWRPDGAGLALAGDKYRGLYYTDIYGNAVAISDANLAGWKFRWSPDGQSLAYRIQQEDGMGMALMVAGPDGYEQITPYLNDLYPPEWDENGITYRSGDEVITLDEEGNVVGITSRSGGKGVLSRLAGVTGTFMMGRITGASFTALASLLTAESTRQPPASGAFIDEENQIWIVDEDGNLKKLIEHENEDGFFDPVRGADGKYAVSGMSGNLYVTDPDTGEVAHVGSGQNPSWSPDGEFFVFERTSDDGHEILSSNLWYSSADGSQVFPITNTDELEMQPSVSPCGNYLAYVIDGVVYLVPIER